MTSRKMAKDVKELIKMIKERPILWDKRNYNDKLTFYKEWDYVARKMDAPIEVVKKKWKSLRDTYAKELKKCIRSDDDPDQDPEYMGTWAYFESMVFITDVLSSRVTRGNIEFINSGIDEETNVSIKSEPTNSLTGTQTDDDDDFDMPLISKVTDREDDINSTNRSEQATHKKRKIAPFEKSFLNVENEKDVFEREENADEDIQWFKSILPHVKELNPLNKLNFRTQVQNVLLTELSKNGFKIT